MSAARLILASGSKARKMLLAQAGLTFDAVPAVLNEEVLLRTLEGKIPVEEIAIALSLEKAKQVSLQHKDAFVIGGDQILSCGGRLYSKAVSLEEARAHLQALRGRTHQLVCGVCVVRNGQALWQGVQTASLHMKNFDDAFLDRYIGLAGDALLKTVGAYELEGQGAWLFDKIEGDYFTILGLPLLPLLGFLSRQGYGP